MRHRLAILWHYVQARRAFHRWRTREALLAWQDQQMQRHLAAVLPRSKVYRERFVGLALADWRTFPIAEKADLMARFDDWNTVGISHDEAWATAQEAERSRDFAPTLRGITVGLSSGTSGARGLFLADAAERALWAGTLLARALHGTLLQPHRAALFLRADSTLYRSISSRRMSFAFFDLMQPLEPQWQRLAEHAPTLLAAPPAVLRQLAQDPRAASLLQSQKLLLSVADVLDEGTRSLIERGFQQRVGQLYQATEGFLAATCAHGSLHWNEDAIVVQKEWLDAAKTRYSPIISDFRRTTQPILRYRLNDIIVEPEQPGCPCGSVFGTIGRIEGRADEVLQLRRADGCAVAVYPDFVRRALLLALPLEAEYAVVQQADESWQVRLSHPEYENRVRSEMATLAATLGATTPCLSFIEYKAPALDQKMRRIRRVIEPMQSIVAP